jgi:hypothetical protein
MQVFTLSSEARQTLAGQIARNGHFSHHLGTDHTEGQGPKHWLIVNLDIEQCGADVSVRVQMRGTINSLTIPQSTHAASRIASFLEELANGDAPEAPHCLRNTMESILWNAICQRQGVYSLSASGVDDLGISLSPATRPGRVIFRFEMSGMGLTLPLLLPNDQEQALELLSGCVQELVANYRGAV